jgi:hypothetical protein
MKICILGSRSIDKAETVIPIIDKFMKDHVSGSPIILSGGAKGVDQITKAYAKANAIPLIEFLPYHLLDNNVEFSSKYFFIRNKQMIDNADKVLVFWDGKSKGTEYGIKYSQKKGIPVMVLKVPI